MLHQPGSFNISDFYEWYKKGLLILQPKFQRRLVWSPTARSYLIDTILRNLPVPKLYIRQQIDVDKHITLREVVDGQQRLQAVFDFLDGNLTVSKNHNTQYCNLKFEELPEEIKEKFLSYQFSVDLLLGASDRDVLDIFTRINSYTLILTQQEKRNAKYSGAFKQTAYKLGLDHLEFWRNKNILTDYRIARMGDAELSSELVVAMIDGLQDGKKTLNKYYDKYDEEFPYAKKVTKEFHETIDLIAFIFGDSLSKTAFSREPLFYSLFCFIYDCKYGLPGSNMGRIKISEKTKKPIFKAFNDLSNIIRKKEPEIQYVEFSTASRSSTDKINERKIRHNYIWGTINKYIKNFN